MSKAERFTEKDILLLEKLDYFKWGRNFTCKRCLHTEYTKGKQPFSRRCKNRACRYDESLLKYTALEGLRFPVEKVYFILRDLIRFSNPKDDEKIIHIGKKNIKKKQDSTPEIVHVEDKNDDDEYISVNDLFSRLDGEEISKEKFDRIFKNYISDRKVTIGRLATKYDLEENTVAMLIHKIDSRIELDEYNDYLTPFQRVANHICGWKLSKLLGMIMFPTDDLYYRGERKIGKKWYKLAEPWGQNVGRWSLEVQTFLRENEKGEYVEYYNKPDEPEYLCEPDWQEHNRILRF